MLAAVIERYGSPEVVHLAERPAPQPGAGHVRVRVGATTVGPSDAAFRSGTDLELLNRLVAEGAFVPIVDRVLPLSEIAAAHARVDSGRKVGALVVTVQGP